MRLPAYILALVLTPPAHALGNAAFSVDPEKILELAIGAIIEQYPEIFLDDLKKPSKTFISCFSTRPDDQLFPLDERFQPCNAFVQFDLGPTHVESRFRDRDNNCIVSADPEDVQIQINEDGVMGAWLRPGSGKQDRIVECTEEFMQLRNPPPVEPLDAEPFYINEEEIVRIAYLAALAAHPDIAPDDLDLDKRIRLSCSARRTAG